MIPHLDMIMMESGLVWGYKKLSTDFKTEWENGIKYLEALRINRLDKIPEISAFGSEQIQNSQSAIPEQESNEEESIISATNN